MTNPKMVKQSETTAAIAQALTMPAPKETKTDALIAMLTRSEGASLEQMVTATGWLPHTTRAALTQLKARGYTVSSVKVDGVRTYRASGPSA